MGFVLSKEKVKINNMLPKNHEIASTIRLWLINSPCTLPPNPVSYSDNDSGYDCE